MSIVPTGFSYHTELIDGLEIEKPLPKRLHGTVQMFLIQWMGRHLPPGFDAIPELNVLCGFDRFIADVTVVRQSARYLNGDLADGADLAVEIFLQDSCWPMFLTGGIAC